jgi:hypothetical protein
VVRSKFADVSEGHTASVFRMKEVKPKRLPIFNGTHGIISQKIVFKV